MRLGKKIRNLIDDHGIDQRQLAGHLGVNPSTISRWCAGISNPDIIVGLAIARYFGVTVEWLADPEAPWPYRPEPARPLGVAHLPLDAGSPQPQGDDQAVRQITDRPAHAPRKR